MRVIGTIRSTATERITVEASSYQEARELLETQIPEGHELIAIGAERVGANLEEIAVGERGGRDRSAVEHGRSTAAAVHHAPALSRLLELGMPCGDLGIRQQNIGPD